MAKLVTPFHRMFFVNDLNISYPHASHERVSVRTYPPPSHLHEAFQAAHARQP